MKGALISIVEVGKNVRLEIKYAVIFSYFFIYVKNLMESCYKSLFYDVLALIQCIIVSLTLAAHLIFSSYVCYLQNSFESLEITESDV